MMEVVANSYEGLMGISKFCSLLPSCDGMYQGFHDNPATHFNGTTCHCPLSEEFAPTWKKLLPDIELPVCQKNDAMTANSLAQHFQFCQDKPTEAYDKIAHLYLEALYQHPPRHEEQNKAFFRSMSTPFHEAMDLYTPANPLVSQRENHKTDSEVDEGEDDEDIGSNSEKNSSTEKKAPHR